MATRVLEGAKESLLQAKQTSSTRRNLRHRSVLFCGKDMKEIKKNKNFLETKSSALSISQQVVRNRELCENVGNPEVDSVNPNMDASATTKRTPIGDVS
jgi:hypothetical protein